MKDFCKQNGIEVTDSQIDEDAKIGRIAAKIADALNAKITYLSLYDLSYPDENDQDPKELKATDDKPSQGRIVTGLQNILKILEISQEKKLFQGEPNGCFDQETRKAVIKFQREIELEADGVAGPLTQKVLAEALFNEVVTESVIKFGEFNHIAVVHENLSDGGEKIKIYVNGELVPAKASKNQKKNININQLNLNQLNPILLGAYSNQNLASLDVSNLLQENQLSHLFRGAIAEVRLWRIARKLEDIKTNMFRRLSGKEPDLIGYWRFEEGEGSQVYNLASQGRISTEYSSIIGSTDENKIRWLSQSNFPAPPLPFALKFDGETENSYVDCGSDSSLDVTDGITVEAWVKHVYGNGLIVGRGGGDESGYALSWVDGRIRVELRNTNRLSEEVESVLPGKLESIQREVIANKDISTVVETQELAPNDGAWHHLAFTWGKISGETNTSQELKEIEIYIDGTRQNCVVLTGQSRSIVAGGQYKTVGLFRGPIGKTTQNLSIGGRQKTTIGSEKKVEEVLNSSIAEVRLWKFARPQNEIKANMYRRLSLSSGEGLIGYWRLDNKDDDRMYNLVSDQKDGIVEGAKLFPTNLEASFY